VNIAAVPAPDGDKQTAAKGLETMLRKGLVTKGLRSAFAGPFDLAVSGGTCATITGPSGSGKSLMLRMIADLDPNEGEVWLDERPRAAMSGPDWRKQAIYVGAESGWWADRAGDHFAGSAHGAIESLAARFGLRDGVLDEPLVHLSTGEKQRLALMRALLKQPKVLLLDEPTAALDQASVGLAETLLQEFHGAGGALVLVTHDPAQAQRLGTQHFRMAAGRLEAA
jgi:putative ABC transport system ATP-binding protein